MLSFESFEKLLSKEFSELFSLYYNEKYIGLNISKENVYLLIKNLKENEKLNFNQLIDITAIDFPSRELRFSVIYILLSLSLNQRVVVKTLLNENDILESITSLYKSANWYERECYDLFGIKFSNHPDLISKTYEKYLINQLRENFDFEGVPINISLRKK